MLQAELPEIKNNFMKRQGARSLTLFNWLSPQTFDQDYDGEYFANLISKSFFDENGNVKNECLKFKKLELEKSNKVIYFLHVNYHFIDPSFPNKWVVKLIFKVSEEMPQETKRREECERLEEIQVALQNKKFNAKGLPRIASVEKSFKLRLRNDLTQYITILHPASGLNYEDILNYYSKAQDAQEAFHHLGKSLAAFHLRFMDPTTLYDKDRDLADPKTTPFDRYIDRLRFYKTIPHNDLAFNNVFFHFRTKRVTLIDTETMALSLHKKASIHRDLEAFCLRPLLYLETLNERSENYFKLYLDCFTEFLTTYVSAYPKSYRPHLIAYLIHFLTDHRFTSIPLDEKDIIEPDLSYQEQNGYERMRDGMISALTAMQTTLSLTANDNNATSSQLPSKRVMN